jgi:1-acyl-sn-glycerol-3-phosphate acyltransferase
MKNISKFILKVLGWKTIGEPAPEPKCIIIGAPHTSAWDFVISWLYYSSMGAVANALVKKEFFFWPVGYFLKKMGGFPIDRSRGANVIRQTINLINENERVHLALTPEGTRAYTKKWKAGFHIIAKETGIPVYLGYFEWGRKEVSIGEKFDLSDDAQADIRRMKDFYREKEIKGRFPELFTTDY